MGYSARALASSASHAGFAPLSIDVFGDDDTREIPLLFLTGLASQGDLKRQQHQLGGRPAISKSAPVDELLARIESLIKP